MHVTFTSAFLRRDPRAASFLTSDFRDPAARCRIAKEAARRSVHPQLAAALREQESARGHGLSSSRGENLDALSGPGSAVVVTGQQVGLFLGPLFTFFKAASTVAAARALERESGVRCIPLFWLQTEDHDYLEINHCHVPRPGGPPLRLELAAPPLSPHSSEARVSVAHRCLGDGVSGQLAILKDALGSLPHAAEFLELLAAHYRPEQTFGAAFAGVLSALFAEEGLLVLDPRCSAVAALSVPLYRQSLLQHDAITAALMARTAALREAGFDEQVHVRPSTALLFLHEDSPGGPRYRPERRDGVWTLPSDCDRRFADEELLALLASEPLRMSTSALLRPLVQDTLLPTAAYVGGPGEINYLAQLPPLYGLLGYSQPLIVPRARFRCLEDNTRALLAKVGLTAAEVEAPAADLLRRIAVREKPGHLAPEALRTRMLADISKCLEEVESFDAGLRDAVRRTRESIEHNVGRLVERYGRTLAERDHVAAERVDRLQGFLFPEGAPQERFYSLPYFACKYGASALKRRVLDLLSPDPFALFGQGMADLDL